MNTVIVSMWYNEAKFAPIFLRHYAWADEIIILLDADTNDDTEEILKKHPKARVILHQFPDGMDDIAKARALSNVVGACFPEHEWAVVVDADEFVFHPEMPVPQALETYGRRADVFYVPFWQMYQHFSENPLTASSEVLTARQYGDPRAGTCFGQGHFNKPIIVRTEMFPEFQPGNHYISDMADYRVSDATRFCGVHWAMADVEIAIDRRIRGRKERMSQVNFHNGLTSHNWHVTKSDIRKECAQHQHDPHLFVLKDGGVQIL